MAEYVKLKDTINEAITMELKPCPFCGGKVRLDTAYSYFRDTVIYCDGCDMVYTLDDCSATKEQIAEAWNRRIYREN